MTVIHFRTRKAHPTVHSEVTLHEASEAKAFLGTDLEAAFEVHRIIFNSMQMEPLRDDPGALGSVLLFTMSQRFGPDLVEWAELQFEYVYGIDPRGFIEHLIVYFD